MKNYLLNVTVVAKILGFNRLINQSNEKRKAYYFLLLLIPLISLNSLDAQMATGKCKFVGNIIAGSVPSTFSTYWNQVTPENSGKWGSVQGSDSTAYNWAGLDLAYNTAKTNNGYFFKQHTFVWKTQQPSFLTGLSDADIKVSVERWIRKFGQRYPNTDLIDVVNEPLHAVPTYFNALGGPGSTGYDWIIWTYEQARKYCPNAKLLINDYNILSSSVNTDTYIGIINILKNRNLIDGIGCQGHGLESISKATITDNLSKLAALGLPIYISEYDVDLSDDNAQLAVYQEQFTLFWNNPMVKGITLWGYQQNQIWRANAYLVDGNGNERLAMVWLKQYVQSTTPAGCSATPVNDVKRTNQDINIFPNPTLDGKISIDVPNGAEAINIMDLGGRLVKTIKLNGESTVEATLNEFPGVYVVQVSSKQGVVYKKLIIK